MKTNIYSIGRGAATILFTLSALIISSFGEESDASTVEVEKTERVFNYNRRARIRPVDMGLDAPRDRYKVDRPSMDRLAEERKESSVFSSDKMIVPPVNTPKPMPQRPIATDEEEKKNWLTPAKLSENDSEDGRNRTLFEQEYDDLKEAEAEEDSLWSSDEEMTEAEREEERYKQEDEEDDDRYSLRKKAIEDNDHSEKRLGILEFKPALERNLYSDDSQTGEGSGGTDADAEGYAVDERLKQIDRRHGAGNEGLEEGEGFSRTAKAMGLGSSDGLDSNRSAKMMSDITDKWLGSGGSPTGNVPKMEDMLKLPKGGGLTARVNQPSALPNSDGGGMNGFRSQEVSGPRGMNLPSARMSSGSFKSPTFSSSMPKPSLNRGNATGFAGSSRGSASFSTPSMPSMNQGFQSGKPAASSTTFGSPYGASGSSSGSLAPRRMKSEMGLGGFKTPKL